MFGSPTPSKSPSGRSSRRVVVEGLPFKDPSVDLKPLDDDFQIRPEVLFDLFKKLHFPGSLYARSRGVHTAGLSNGAEVLTIAEDVGRHNTVDKLLGKCMLEGIETKGRILLATGRVSSEMLVKGAMMGCPIIASRNSATSMSVEMARSWNITLIGYVKQSYDASLLTSTKARLHNSS